MDEKFRNMRSLLWAIVTITVLLYLFLTEKVMPQKFTKILKMT